MLSCARMERINPSYFLDATPASIPGLISFWRFTESDARFPSIDGEPYVLESRSGPLPVERDEAGPLGGSALILDEGSWLSIPRHKCPALDIHGPDGHLSVVAWVNRARTSERHCEFIAGQWNETNRGRQYGLFINISVWQEEDQVCGHVSNVGGPTPGFRYCIDGGVGATAVRFNEWAMVGMTYDGVSSAAWLGGRLDLRPELNPYPLPGGLHDGGRDGSDFTVGAVDRGGAIGNFFAGKIAGLAVYGRALGPAEMRALSRM